MEIIRAVRAHLICLVVGHNWSDWQVPDPDRPSEQTRVCARCSKTKGNSPPAPFPYYTDITP